MITKYAVYNSDNGKHDYFDTIDDALLSFWEKVIKIAKQRHGNTAYMRVDINDQGHETWYNDQDNQIEKPLTREEILNLIAISNTSTTSISTST